MGRSLEIRNPTVAAIRKIEELLTQDLHPQQQRRAQVILLYSEGLTGADMAFALKVNPLTHRSGFALRALVTAEAA
jgi:hypothetical protein